jgi:hypothetical protein
MSSALAQLTYFNSYVNVYILAKHEHFTYERFTLWADNSLSNYSMYSTLCVTDVTMHQTESQPVQTELVPLVDSVTLGCFSTVDLVLSWIWISVISHCKSMKIGESQT